MTCANCMNGVHDGLAYLNCDCSCHCCLDLQLIKGEAENGVRSPSERVLEGEGSRGLPERENAFKRHLERNRELWRSRGDVSANPSQHLNKVLLQRIRDYQAEEEDTSCKVVERNNVVIERKKEGVWNKIVKYIARLSMLKNLEKIRHRRRVSFLE